MYIISDPSSNLQMAAENEGLADTTPAGGGFVRKQALVVNAVSNKQLDLKIGRGSVPGLRKVKARDG